MHSYLCAGHAKWYICELYYSGPSFIRRLELSRHQISRDSYLHISHLALVVNNNNWSTYLNSQQTSNSSKKNCGVFLSLRRTFVEVIMFGEALTQEFQPNFSFSAVEIVHPLLRLRVVYIRCRQALHSVEMRTI